MNNLRSVPYHLRRKMMVSGFTEFIKERKYLTNVTPATIHWHTCAFKWLNTDFPTQKGLKAAVLGAKNRDLGHTPETIPKYSRKRS